MTIDPVSVAVVGGGYWGKNLIRNFAALPGARLDYVCELDAARQDSVRVNHPDVRITSRLADVLEDAQVQAVVIATPADTHRTVAEACLRGGKDVFVEKPIATTVADARALVDVAEREHAILQVGHLFLHDPAVRALIDLVRGGKIGTIRYINVVRTSMGGTARLDTSILWDALIHDAYILPAICGRPPARVRAQGWGYLSDLEDVVFATFDFGEKAVGSCYDSWYALEKARQITVVGSKGILYLDEFRDPKLVFFDRKYVLGDERDPKGRQRWQWLDHGQEPQAVPIAESLREECLHFVDCVRHRRQPLAGGREGLAAVLVIQACAESQNADGAWVALGSAAEESYVRS